jgi:hypothetical protein
MNKKRTVLAEVMLRPSSVLVVLFGLNDVSENKTTFFLKNRKLIK